jgi:hypothetical protein
MISPASTSRTVTLALGFIVLRRVAASIASSVRIAVGARRAVDRDLEAGAGVVAHHTLSPRALVVQIEVSISTQL